ncbi:MAG: GntR family transcriptional regulator [Erysipelotrichaceae bacterium]|nr:GntR family transcriptional regulator [Erysipelotrichaceae bacterium]
MSWNFKSDQPIYSQIIERIQIRIVQGQYPPGSRLPSVRELALEAGVNPNTVQRAYADLEQNGFLRTERTNGKFVTEDEEMLRRLRMSLSKGYIEEFFHKMKELGFDEQGIFETIRAEKGEIK